VKIPQEIIQRGNAWVSAFKVSPDCVEFVELKQNQTSPASVIVVLKSFQNKESKEAGFGGHMLKVEYKRFDLKTLSVKLQYSNEQEFYEKALDAINQEISLRKGTEFQLRLSDIDITKCKYGVKESRIAVTNSCLFWYDYCQISNVLTKQI
jgi:hypothetical protein